jgi:hypothetical protein
MIGKEPVSAQSLSADGAAVTPWVRARRRLEDAETYWLATVRPDGRPHVMPVLAVWVDGALHFCAGAATRKAKNLKRDSHCVITARNDALDLVIEGQAMQVRDDATLSRVAEGYASKYGWPVVVRGGAFYGEGAPSAGPPPYEVYEVVPTVIFGFGTDETSTATRWRFQ